MGAETAVQETAREEVCVGADTGVDRHCGILLPLLPLLLDLRTGVEFLRGKTYRSLTLTI